MRKSYGETLKHHYNSAMSGIESRLNNVKTRFKK